MPKIRSLKPGFCTSEAIVELDKVTRLHFAMLWTYADDYGRGVDNPKLIKAALWPLDDDMGFDEVDAMQDELARHGRIIRYIHDGKRLFQIANWQEHQHPKKPVDSVFPASNDTECSPYNMGGDDGTPEAPPEGEVTTPAGVDGNPVDPLVVEVEVEVESGRVGKTEDDDKEVIHSSVNLGNVWRILAVRALNARTVALGPVGDADSWLTEAERRKQNTHGQRLDELRKEHPDWTIERIADELEPTKPPEPTHTSKLQRPDCEKCGGRGVVEVDEDQFAKCDCTRVAVA